MTSKIKQLTIASVDRACGGLTRPLKQLAAVLICFGQRYISPSSTVLLDRPFDCLPPPPPPPTLEQMLTVFWRFGTVRNPF